MAIEEIDIETGLRELGLPADSKFCGYVVHLPEEDEFLATLQKTRSTITRAFCKIPQFAKIYHDHKEAMRDARGCKQEAIVCLLFDINDKYAVVPIGE